MSSRFRFRRPLFRRLSGHQVFNRPAPLAGFAVFACLPGLLLLAGVGFGGLWIWLALIWIGGASQIADTVISHAFADPETERDLPGADRLSVLLALLHIVLLVAGLWRLSAGALAPATWIALFLGLGLFFGQVSNSNAHELIHRPSRALFRLGAAVYVSLLFGHHTSAHRLVHHRHVATPQDPNSARLGESFWRFLPRAWLGSFRQGLRAERARLTGRQRLNPYVIWIGGGLACCLIALAAFGPAGLAIYLGLCLYAQVQLLLSDYVQHYGLVRRKLENGRHEPAGPLHSWDAPHLLSALMMVNAPRHSDHHAHPARSYPDLRLNRAAHPRPMLPWPLPVMASIAIFPPLWRRVMDRRVARMHARQDLGPTAMGEPN